MKTTSFAITLAIATIIAIPSQGIAGEVVPWLIPAAKPADDWPAPVIDVVREVLTIKAEAMKSKHMRSRDRDSKSPTYGVYGQMGRKFDACMDKLATVAEEEKIKDKALEKEGTDIVAKLVVLAMDRKMRKDKYNFIAEEYINCPETIEGMEAYYKHRQVSSPNDPFAGPPRIGLPHDIRPLPMLKEHMTDEYRLPLEYGYFAPPTGMHFAVDARIILRGALQNIAKPEKTQILMAVDYLSSISMDVAIYDSFTQMDSMIYLLEYPSPFSRDVLAGSMSMIGWQNKCVNNMLDYIWGHWMASGITTLRTKWQDYFAKNPPETEGAKALKQAIESRPDPAVKAP